MARIPKIKQVQTQAATRQRLLKAAVVEFAYKGYSEANINAISTAAGFAKGTIYNYFPSKQALVLALIAETGGSHMQYVAEQVRQESDPVQRLVRFFESGFRFVEDHPDQARFLITTLYSADRELQEAMAQAYQPMFRLVAQEILEPGIKHSIFRPMDLMPTANLVMTIYLGTGSHVDRQGKVYMDPHQVSDFVLRSLLVEGSNTAN